MEKFIVAIQTGKKKRTITKRFYFEFNSKARASSRSMASLSPWFSLRSSASRYAHEEIHRFFDSPRFELVSTRHKKQ